MKTIQDLFGGVAKFAVLLGGGVLLLGCGMFFWSISETWDSRHTDSLLLWGGILLGGGLFMLLFFFMILMILRFVLAQQAQQSGTEMIRDGYAPPQVYNGGMMQGQLPMGNYAPMQMQPQGQYYQPQMQQNQFAYPPPPPPEGSFTRTNVQYNLEA